MSTTSRLLAVILAGIWSWWSSESLQELKMQVKQVRPARDALLRSECESPLLLCHSHHVCSDITVLPSMCFCLCVFIDDDYSATTWDQASKWGTQLHSHNFKYSRLVSPQGARSVKEDRHLFSFSVSTCFPQFSVWFTFPPHSCRNYVHLDVLQVKIYEQHQIVCHLNRVI